MTERVLFYVQHLVGVGHVFRASRIVRALRREGLDVDVVFGGVPIPDLDIADARIHYLPPVRAGQDVFNKLEDGDGNAVDDAFKARRRDLLLNIFAETRPDVIVTEAFPFGRRQMRFELLPLMEAAHARSPRPTIVSSVRDILQRNKKPERDREVVDILDRWFDRVLVHGDPRFVAIGHTFPHADEIAGKLLYTGIVAPDRPTPATGDDAFDVVISVGGGATLGHKLLVSALEARKDTVLADARWLALTGLAPSAEQQAELAALTDRNVVCRNFMPNLPSLLAAAKLSISRVGYNTVADVYAAGCRSIVVPFSDGIETEQIERAELMDRQGLAVALRHDEETPGAIARAIDRVMAAPLPERPLDIGGAENSARILAALARGEAPEA